MDIKQQSELFGVSERTVRRWLTEGMPHYATERLSLINGTHSDWLGFKILHGKIIVPCGDIINKSEIEHFRWMQNQLRDECRRNSFLSELLDDVKHVQEAANEPSCLYSLHRLTE